MKNCIYLWTALPCLLLACQKDPLRVIDSTYNPVILPGNFTGSTNLTNVYFPFEMGKTYVYEGQTADGLEHVEVQLLAATKTVMGIACVVVNDKVWLNGALIEDTDDWYAQDNNGNVWYFGEEVDNYKSNGKLKDHGGSWEAGVDGAKPGIAMLAAPQAGMTYRQEYYFNEAEDEAEVVAVGLTVTIPFGTFQNCIKTKDITALEPDVLEYKYYAPGIGLVREENPKDGEELTLVDIKG